MDGLWFFAMICYILGGGSLIGLTFAVIKKKREAVVVLSLFVFLCFMLAHGASVVYGKMMERTLNPVHNYIVKAKKQGNEMPFLVYDMVDKKDRVIDFEGYPPSEFNEVLMADGKIMLIPK